MARALRCLAAFLVCLTGLTALGCAKPAVQQPSPEPTATALQNVPQVQANQIDVADMLIGFVIPQSEDIALCTAMHGFLRTAENLGYPAKLYRAEMGAQSVVAVEQAAEEGCKGLLLWNPGGANAAALEKAAALSIPAIVPYHDAPNGATANVVADLMGYTEEIALSLAERMVERECKAGKILVYGRNPQPAYEKFTQSIAEYYPQFNVGYFTRTEEDEQAAIDELAEYILWNRDIKGLFSADADGASVASRARAQAQARFKKDGAPEASSTSPFPAPSAPSATPVPSGLIKSIVISVAAYGISEKNITLMRSEDIYAFVLEPYYEASAQSVMLLDRVMSGERVPAVSRLNMPIVRKVTLDKYAFIHNQVQDWFELKKS